MKVGFGGKPCVKTLLIRLNMANKFDTELRVLAFVARDGIRGSGRSALLRNLDVFVCLRRTTKLWRKLRSSMKLGLGMTFA